MPNGDAKWNKMLLGVSSAMFVIIVGMISFFVAQYDKRITTLEHRLESMQTMIDGKISMLQDKSSDTSKQLVRIETKLDMILEKRR